MRRAHIENHFLADVVIGFAQFRFLGGNARYRIGRFNFAHCEGHRGFMLATRSVGASVNWPEIIGADQRAPAAQDAIGQCR